MNSESGNFISGIYFLGCSNLAYFYRTVLSLIWSPFFQTRIISRECNMQTQLEIIMSLIKTCHYAVFKVTFNSSSNVEQYTNNWSAYNCEQQYKTPFARRTLHQKQLVYLRKDEKAWKGQKKSSRVPQDCPLL